ncbi:MAG: hypothetical protein IJE49_12710 [Agathobacter sp.]|nr:hypothetical protein [Agathobacter sp.]MBQ2902687.1 hypothetical protein [Agathobacter sp.]
MKASANVDIVTDASLNDAIEIIRAQHENAEIVVEDGVIHVYVGEESKNHGVALLAVENRIWAPEGGTWADFVPPWYTFINPSAVIPYSVLYLPHTNADALFVTRATNGLYDLILKLIADNLDWDTIIYKILIKFGVEFTKGQLLFIASSYFYNIYRGIDLAMFGNTLTNAGLDGVRIDFTTVGGWPVNYYYVWDSDYVTDSPWQDFGPNFYKGIYSSSDI